jgi:hypothetical protein
VSARQSRPLTHWLCDQQAAQQFVVMQKTASLALMVNDEGQRLGPPTKEPQCRAGTVMGLNAIQTAGVLPHQAIPGHRAAKLANLQKADPATRPIQHGQCRLATASKDGHGGVDWHLGTEGMRLIEGLHDRRNRQRSEVKGPIQQPRGCR